jgi:uridine phosphorylase
MKTAWYSGHQRRSELGDSAILVGDPDRVERIGALLDEPVFLPVKRGLKTVTGGVDHGKRGELCPRSAWGRRSPRSSCTSWPILGSRGSSGSARRCISRPARPGDFVISDSAISF